MNVSREVNPPDNLSNGSTPNYATLIENAMQKLLPGSNMLLLMKWVSFIKYLELNCLCV